MQKITPINKSKIKPAVYSLNISSKFNYKNEVFMCDDGSNGCIISARTVEEAINALNESKRELDNKRALFQSTGISSYSEL